MKCEPIKNCTKPVCELSQWSEWSNCTDKCNGVKKRYRTYFGEKCDKNNTLVEATTCDDCRCLINGTYYAVYSYYISNCYSMDCLKLWINYLY